MSSLQETSQISIQSEGFNIELLSFDPREPRRAVRPGHAGHADNLSGVNDTGAPLLCPQGARDKELVFFFFVPNLITLPLLLIGAQWSRDRYGRLRPGRGAAPASGGRLNPRSSLGGVWRRWPAAPGSEAQLGTPGASQVRSGLTYLLISGRSGGVAHAAPASSSRL